MSKRLTKTMAQYIVFKYKNVQDVLARVHSTSFTNLIQTSTDKTFQNRIFKIFFN